MRIAFALALAMALIGATPALAEPGDVDTSFGTGGRVTLPVALDPDYPSVRTSVMGGRGNEVVVAGIFDDTNRGNAFVARYGVNGQPVTSFGTDGIVHLNDASATKFPEAQDVAIDPAGRVLVLLEIVQPKEEEFGAYTDTVLRRFNPDGTRDTTFGADGAITIQSLRGGRLTVAPDSSVAVGGSSDWFGAAAVVWRFDSNGAPAGMATRDISGSEHRFADLSFDSAGRLVVLAADQDGNQYLERWGAGGPALAHDLSFGANGVLPLPVDEGYRYTTLRISGGGMLLLAEGSQLLRLLSLTADGAPTPGFGDAAGRSEVMSTRGMNDSLSGAIAVQADGKILSAGSGLARWTSSGAVDDAYGDGGKAPGPEADYFARGVALDAQDRPLRAFTTANTASLTRLLAGAGELDTTPPSLTLTGPSTLTSPNPTNLTYSLPEPRTFIDCSDDGGPFQPCDNGGARVITDTEIQVHPGANGPHSLSMRAYDQSGNVTTRTVNWTTAVTAPEITAGPGARTNQTQPVFAVNGSPYCTLDGASTQCNGATPVLAEGSHTFVAGYGSSYPSTTRTFVVDTTVPDTEIVAQPDAGDRTPSVSFRATDDDSSLSYECRVIGAGNPFDACSSPWTTEVPEGRSYLQVRARDSAGNVDPRGEILEVHINADGTGTVGPGDPSTPGAGGGGGGGGDAVGPGEGPVVPRLPATIPVFAGDVGDECRDGVTVKTRFGSITMRADGGMNADAVTGAAGTLTFVVTTPAPKPVGTASIAAAAKRKTIVYAKGKKSLDASGALVLIKPTGKGRKAVRAKRGKARVLRLTVKGQFRPKAKGGKPITMTKRLRIVFKPGQRKSARTAQGELCPDPHPPFAAVYMEPTPKTIGTLPPDKAEAMMKAYNQQPGMPDAPQGARSGPAPASNAFCDLFPKRCVTSERFCALNPHMCRYEKDICRTDSTLCLISNHNFCSRYATRCDYARLGVIVIWDYNYCQLSDGNDCEANEACEVNETERKIRRYAYDCKPNGTFWWPQGIPTDLDPPGGPSNPFKRQFSQLTFPWPPFHFRLGGDGSGTGPSMEVPYGGKPGEPAGSPRPRPDLKIDPPKQKQQGPRSGGGPGGCPPPRFLFAGECAMPIGS